MEELYKNRTYTIEYEKPNGMDLGGYRASWLGYSAIGHTKEQALERCHKMIEKDF